MTVSLDEIVAFVRVVERGSFRAAATELGLVPSVVTKRVQALEAALAVQLLVRTTRRTTPTDAGQLFFDEVRRVPAALAEAEERVRDAGLRARGRLRVIMPTYFASSGFHHQVIPAYMRAHPDVQLGITIVGDPLEHLADEFDLLVAGKLPNERMRDTSFVTRRLLEFRTALFATPAYLAEHGEPAHPRDLVRHNCISYPRRDWSFVAPDGERITVHVSGTLTTNSNAMMYAATMNGLGIAQSFPYFFDAELTGGRVVSVLDAFTRRAHVDIHLVYPAARFLPKRTRAFIDALAAHFAPAPQGKAPRSRRRAPS